MTCDAPFENMVKSLLRSGDQRVWSLIITLFGDMAQTRTLSGQQISRITAKLAIKPETTRVALYRLRKDGWISSEKSGRNSLHQLTDMARRQSADASTRIYEKTEILPQKWHMLVADNPTKSQLITLLDAGYLPLGDAVFMRSGTAEHPFGFVVACNAATIPDWVKGKLFPPDLMKMIADFHEVITKLTPQSLSATEIVALRLLIVHQWRKIVLRYPVLPAGFYPKNWQGNACRLKMGALLDSLPRPSLTDI